MTEPILTPQTRYWAQCAFAALLVLLTWNVTHAELPYLPLIGDIDTAVHEFGHYLWMPLGETMSILGGSLTQVLFPMIFVGYFLRKRDEKRDVYAAMICLWWVGLNLLEVSVYVNDARAGELMLLNGATGQESDAHDWYNLLARWHALQSDHAIAGAMRGLSKMLFAGSIIGAVAAARRLRSASSASPDPHSPH